MPGRYAGSLHSSLISTLWWLIACLLFLTPHKAYSAYAKATSFPTAQALGLKTVCGDGSNEWVTLTCDGFPAFNPNNCAGHSVYSNDGHNTNDDPPSPPNEFRSYHYIPGNPNASGGYICRELAIRYFKFRWGINIAGDNDQLGVPCETHPGSKVIPKGGSPVPGDVAVYSGCDDPFGGCSGHIAVVDHYNPTTQMVTLVNQNFGSKNGYTDFKVTQATCYIHALANQNTANTDDNTCEPGAGAAADCTSSQTEGAGAGNKLCKNKKGEAIYCTTCDAQIPYEPNVFSFDGYPAFNSNHCLSYGDTWSTDGFNTYPNKASIPTTDPNYSKAYATDIGGGGYQCMEFGNRYFHFKYGIDLRGNPADYCDSGPNSKDPADGSWVHTNKPAPGDLMMFNGRMGCGINDAGIGHVAVVNSVDPDGTVHTANQNWSRPSMDDKSAYKAWPSSCACTFLHATKNASVSMASTCSLKFRQEAYSLAVFNTGITGTIDRNGDLMVFSRNVFGWVWSAIHDLPPLLSPPFFNHWTPFNPVMPPAVVNAVSDPVAMLHPGDKRIEFFYVGIDPWCELASIAVTASTAGLVTGPSCSLNIWHDWQTHAAWEACLFGACAHIPGWWSLVPHHLQDNKTHPRSNVSVINFHGTTMVFYLSSTDDGNIWELEDHGGSWTDPVNLKVGKNGIANLTVIAVGNTIHIFYPGPLMTGNTPDKSDVLYVWHTYSSSGSSGWSKPYNLGDVVTSNIAAAVNPDGRLEIFYRGAAEELRHMWQLSPGPKGTWNQPVPPAAAKDFSQVLLYDPSLGPIMTSDPAVATYVPNKDNTGNDQLGTPNTDRGTINTFNGSDAGKPMQVFYRGSDGYVWTMWRVSDTPTHNGIWSPTMEISHEMVTASPITVIPNNDSTPHVFFYGPLSIALDRFGENLGIPGAGALMQIGTIIADPILKWCDLAWNVHQVAPGSNEPRPNYPGNWSKLDMIFGLINRNPNQATVGSSGAPGTIQCSGQPPAQTAPMCKTKFVMDSAGMTMLAAEESHPCHPDSCPSVDGHITFGYGLDLYENPSQNWCELNGTKVQVCPNNFSQADLLTCANQTFARELQGFSDCVNKAVANYCISQAQFDALTSLAYNTGCGGLHSFMSMNAGNFASSNWNAIGASMPGFRNNGGELRSRRQKECNMFITGNPEGKSPYCN
ncbi:MAG TPA: CHAP domain-containing protein [Rickettsiales bacterium]|nr:CHAP domain-containing protein [Rickettsiales bacterium]